MPFLEPRAPDAQFSSNEYLIRLVQTHNRNDSYKSFSFARRPFNFLRFFRLFKIVPFTSIKKWYEKYTHVVLTVRDVTFFWRIMCEVGIKVPLDKILKRKRTRKKPFWWFLLAILVVLESDAFHMFFPEKIMNIMNEVLRNVKCIKMNEEVLPFSGSLSKTVIKAKPELLSAYFDIHRIKMCT